MGIRGNPPKASSVIKSVTVTAPVTAPVHAVAYSQTATAVLVDVDDGTYSKVWSISGVSGLAIDQTGKITGTATAAGTATITLKVTDSKGTMIQGTASLVVT